MTHEVFVSAATGMNNNSRVLTSKIVSYHFFFFFRKQHFFFLATIRVYDISSPVIFCREFQRQTFFRRLTLTLTLTLLRNGLVAKITGAEMSWFETIHLSNQVTIAFLRCLA